MSQAVIGIAESLDQVQLITHRLQSQAAVPEVNISILVPETSAVRDIGHVKTSKAPEGAATGVVAGGLTGGALGFLAGIGLLAIPGLGPFIAAGPIMAALSGAAAGAATIGLLGALIGMGIPEYEAKIYEGKLKTGSFLIAVHNVKGKQVHNVEEIFKQEGAADISAVEEEGV